LVAAAVRRSRWSGSLVTAAVLVLLLAGRGDEFESALSAASVSVLAATVLLQVLGLLARSEAWHLTIQAAGGTVERRVLYRASSMQVQFPILAIEAVLAALASFTLVAPLGIPWWLPLILVVLIGTVSAGLRHLAFRKGRELWKGLAVLRNLGEGSRVFGFMLVAVFA